MKLEQNTIILEFNGLPGSGKTTLANILIKQQAYTIESYKEVLEKRSIRSKFLRKIFNLLKLLKLDNLKIGYYSFCIILDNKKMLKKNIFRAYKMISLFDFYKNELKKKNKTIILVDQGIVQQLISILYCSEMTNKVGIEKLVSFMKERIHGLYFVSIDVETCTSIDRLNSRNDKGSRIQKMNNDDAEKILKLQQKNFAKVRKILSEHRFNSLDLNAEEAIDVNIDKVNSFIDKVLNNKCF